VNALYAPAAGDLDEWHARAGYVHSGIRLHVFERIISN
jgi:hypothetical protein